MRVEPHHVLAVFEHRHGVGAIRAQIVVLASDGLIKVGLGEDGVHPPLNVIEPVAHTSKLRQLRVRRGQLEPRPRRARHARHKASLEDAASSQNGLVVDLLVLLLAFVVLGLIEAQGLGGLILLDLLPQALVLRALCLHDGQALAPLVLTARCKRHRALLSQLGEATASATNSPATTSAADRAAAS